jgi:succinate dehydrogenase/fumarate reductase-like Fe-S protein
VALDRKWLYAQFNLGWKVVVHYLAKLSPWSTRYGLVRFQQNYVVEGLPPATPSFRALAHEPGRCTTCGSCDRACPALASDPDFMGPMRFVVAGARAAPYLDDVKDALRVLTSPSCADCQKCEAACPEGIPILAIAAALQAQAVVVKEAVAGQVPVRPGDVKGLLAARPER